MATVDPLGLTIDQQLLLSFVVSAVSAAYTWWDASRRGGNRFFWGFVGFLGGVFGVLAWVIYRRFVLKQAGAPAETRERCGECQRPLADDDLAFCGACGAPRSPAAQS